MEITIPCEKYWAEDSLQFKGDVKAEMQIWDDFKNFKKIQNNFLTPAPDGNDVAKEDEVAYGVGKNVISSEMVKLSKVPVGRAARCA